MLGFVEKCVAFRIDLFVNMLDMSNFLSNFTMLSISIAQYIWV